MSAGNPEFMNTQEPQVNAITALGYSAFFRSPDAAALWFPIPCEATKSPRRENRK